MKKEVTLKLKPMKFALAAAILAAATILIVTLMATVTQYPSLTKLFLILYGDIGYSTSTAGAFLGAIYGFVDTFILAWIFAWLYNKLA
jgi:hypothetical protein